LTLLKSLSIHKAAETISGKNPAKWKPPDAEMNLTHPVNFCSNIILLIGYGLQVAGFVTCNLKLAAWNY
jgi:hypothetical protein